MPKTKRERVADVTESKDKETTGTPAPLSGLAVPEAVGQSCKTKSPFDVYFEALKKCVEGALGYIVVRGIRDDDEDDNDDEEHSDEEDSTEKYSDEQMNMTRVVLVTKSREKFMEKTDKFATCGQAGSGCMMFNTHSGNVIISGIPKEILKILKN